MSNALSNRLCPAFGKVWNALGKWWRRNEIVVAIYGLDGAGATTILYNAARDTPRTEIWVTFTLWKEYTRCHFNTRLQLWDLHLSHHFQVYWRRFSQRDKIKVLIWVVDANHHIRFEEGRYALKDFLDGGDVPQGIPLLVLANKQDLPGAVNVTELARELQLRDIHGRPWHIMPTAGITGEGLKEAFEWVTMVVDRVKRGNTKIEYKSAEADNF